jgi:hypothetical protein
VVLEWVYNPREQYCFKHHKVFLDWRGGFLCLGRDQKNISEKSDALRFRLLLLLRREYSKLYEKLI